MKTLLAAIIIVMSMDATAQVYECKVDSKGTMVCYPKPRGF